MKDASGKQIKVGQTVQISARCVKLYALPDDKGVVVECRSNSAELVSVKLPSWNKPVDFHVKSLTIQD